MTAWENSRGKLNWFCKALSYSKDSLSFLLDKMKLPITVLVSLILISDFVASASDWKQKAKILIKLEPSNLFVKCGNAEYTSKEIDNAANEACYRKFTKGKVFGIPVKPQPKIYKGNKLITFDEDSQSSHHFSRHTYHHRTHILKFDHHPFLMWPLENKLRHVNGLWSICALLLILIVISWRSFSKNVKANIDISQVLCYYSMDPRTSKMQGHSSDNERKREWWHKMLSGDNSRHGFQIRWKLYILSWKPQSPIPSGSNPIYWIK